MTKVKKQKADKGDLAVQIQGNMTFKKNYFALALLIFLLEAIIAIYVRDSFVRPYLGDVLVVILIYCFVRSFLNLPVFNVAMGTLAFAFTVEFLQYLRLIELLKWEKSQLAKTVVGTSFAWIDLVAYVAGVAIVLVVEKYLLKKMVWLKTV